MYAVIMVECDGVDGILRHTRHTIRMYIDLQMVSSRVGRRPASQLTLARTLRCATFTYMHGQCRPFPNHPAGEVPHLAAAAVAQFWQHVLPRVPASPAQRSLLQWHMYVLLSVVRVGIALATHTA